MQVKSSKFCYNLHIPKFSLSLVLSFSGVKKEFTKSVLVQQCLSIVMFLVLKFKPRIDRLTH